MTKSNIEGGAAGIAASGLKAQQARMRVLAENIANAASTARTPEGEPYRRQVPVFRVAMVGEERGVEMAGVKPDPSAFPKRYDPGHPAANAAGYVQLPNVSSLAEALDFKQAMRSYEANLNIMESQDAMDKATLSILNKR
jgi:flagellar basal-body rod protein FlgC